MEYRISTHSLRQLIKLTEQRHRLVKELKRIETRLAALMPGEKTLKVSGRRGRLKANRQAKGSGRGKRGSLGRKVLAALESAGPAGVKVAELAKEIGVKGTNLHVWFGTTGKKHAKKIGRGHYRLKN